MGRLRNREAVDAVVGEWVAGQQPQEAQSALMRAGVPAGEVLTMGAATRNEHLRARRMYPEMEHPVIGRLFTFGMPTNFVRTDIRTGGRSPLYGEHTRDVLQRLANLTDAEYGALEAEGVAGKRPENVQLR
jgi:formyl-CoA transferase